MCVVKHSSLRQDLGLNEQDILALCNIGWELCLCRPVPMASVVPGRPEST